MSRNTNAQSVFDAYTHRPVVRSGYCESIMFYDGEAAAIGQDVAVVTTGEPITNATIPHTQTLLSTTAHNRTTTAAVTLPLTTQLAIHLIPHQQKQ